MITNKDISLLEDRLDAILPVGDVLFNIDFSTEDMADIYEEAWWKADNIAREAIHMLNYPQDIINPDNI